MSSPSLPLHPPLKITPRRPSAGPHKLPKGWRWLRLGEWVEVGDVSCDPRSEPVKIIKSGWQITSGGQPTRRHIASEKRRLRLHPNVVVRPCVVEGVPFIGVK